MTDTPAGAPLAGERIGPYRLDAPIGSGGMGTVWRAWDERLRRHVAVKKVLRDSGAHGRERLRREARAAAQLSHPAIVHIYDFLEGDDADWIVMELVSGQNLRQVLDRVGYLEVGQALQLGHEIAEGLAEAHAHGILHRDLKTANIMVTAAGRAKILDFGLAKVLQEDGTATGSADPSLSVTGVALGTCFAMSPEQAMGHDLDARSDLFSFGSLFYEVLTGGAPFRAENNRATLARVLQFRPRPLHEVRPAVPRGLSRLVERLLEKEPQDRPAGAGEVCEVLASLAAGAFKSAGSAASATAETLVDSPVPKAVRSRSGGSGSGGRAQTSERRRLTVICCGLVGLGEAPGETCFLEIEAFSEIMSTVQEVACRVVEPLGGCYGSTLGHVLWLYFGYPRAQEDDAQRAIRAASSLLAEIRQHGTRLVADGQGIALRIAIHAGPAIITARPGEPVELQLGSTLAVATDLQDVAPPNEIVVSGPSHSTASRGFSLERLPPVRLQGLARPVELYRVVAPLDRRDSDSGEVIPIVGRIREIELLVDRLRLSCSGVGQAVMIQGEAGIGKSRLVRALREQLTGQDALWLVAYGSPYTQSSPLVPVIDLLARLLFGPAEETADQKLLRLEEVLDRYGLLIAENAPLLALLLDLPADQRYPPLTITPDGRRAKTLEVLVALLVAMSERRPLVLVVEDLHWIDPSTLELLELLLEEIDHISLFLVATFRPEFQAPWKRWSQITQIGLSRLTGAETQELIDQVAPDRELSAEMRRQIVEKTDGVPLFIEELTKAVIESGLSGNTLDIPSTLEGSLMARLDRLGEAKNIAQYAAVIGRVFSFELLAAISQCESDILRRNLDELVRAELLHRRGGTSGVTYVFKHALIQDVAYLSLLKRRRQEIHEGIARALEERLQKGHETEPEILAYHFERAVLIPHAVTYLQQAAARAIQRSAYNEAESHCSKGIELLEILPASQLRWEQELSLRNNLSLALIPIRGYASQEVEDNTVRCGVLCRELGDTARLIPSLYGLWLYHLLRGHRQATRELAEEICRLAEGGSDEISFIAWSVRGTTSFFEGAFEDVRTAMAQAMAIYRADLHPVIAQSFGEDACLLPNCYYFFVLWFLGLPDEAVRIVEETRQIVRGLSSPYIQVATRYFEMIVWRELRRPEDVFRLADQVIDLAREQRFTVYLALASCGFSWASMQRGEPESGMAQVQALENLKATGAMLPVTYFTAPLVETYLYGNRFTEGLATVDEALSLTEVQLDVFYEAELYRLKGELLLRVGDLAVAEAAFRRALEIAARQGSPALELRAATSLGRLLREQGRIDEARQLVAGAYGAFREGFETRDLQDARQLLDELA